MRKLKRICKSALIADDGIVTMMMMMMTTTATATAITTITISIVIISIIIKTTTTTMLLLLLMMIMMITTTTTTTTTMMIMTLEGAILHCPFLIYSLCSDLFAAHQSSCSNPGNAKMRYCTAKSCDVKGRVGCQFSKQTDTISAWFICCLKPVTGGEEEIGENPRRRAQKTPYT